MSKRQDRVLSYIKKHRVVRPRDLRGLDVHSEVLRRLCKKGQLLRVSRGLYELPGAEPDPNQSLIEVCKQAPAGVICLLSALRFHGIGTQLPHEVWLAIPAKGARPRIGNPRIRVVYLSGRMYSEGVEAHQRPGGKIKAYSVAKTVVDCFRFRNQVGIDVAVEALRESLRNRKATIAQISEMAKLCRCETVIRPYLEAMI
jgi:predicted transcriptional regulator of viral defense system